MQKSTFEGVDVITAQIKPQKRLILSMAPYLSIPQDEHGFGGGITLRIKGENQEPYLVDVVWGEKTEIEVIL